MTTKIYYGVTFKDGKKELFNTRIYTYSNRDDAKRNSMNFSICRFDTGDLDKGWDHFYRGQLVQVKYIKTEYDCD